MKQYCLQYFWIQYCKWIWFFRFIEQYDLYNMVSNIIFAL